MWIKGVGPAEAAGELKDLYERIGGARGGVAAIHQAQSLNPKVLGARFEMYKAVMFGPSPLSRADREAIAVAVSRANACDYCAAHHGAALDQLGMPPPCHGPCSSGRPGSPERRRRRQQPIYQRFGRRVCRTGRSWMQCS